MKATWDRLEARTKLKIQNFLEFVLLDFLS